MAYIINGRSFSSEWVIDETLLKKGQWVTDLMISMRNFVEIKKTKKFSTKLDLFFLEVKVETKKIFETAGSHKNTGGSVVRHPWPT